MRISELKRKYLLRLPDVPRWVETRDLLSSEASTVIENSSLDGFIVWSGEDDIGSVVGQVDSVALSRAASEVSEFLAFPDNIDKVRDILENFYAEPATIFNAPPELPSPSKHRCVKIELQDVELLEHLPVNLKEEICDALEDDIPVVAAFDGVLPVAFAYVASVTESLWDISIDTIESHRRNGYAAAAVVQLMTLMQRNGKAAVWGALKSNPASVKLAQHLGFNEIDEIWVLTRKTT